jgi:hypothetical protein
MSVNIPANLAVYEFTNPTNHKYNVKLRDLLEGLTHSVQEYIFNDCDNDGASEEFRREVRQTLGTILGNYTATIYPTTSQVQKR